MGHILDYWFGGKKRNKLIYGEECYKIIGACFEVYNNLGSGFLENVYQEALEIELRNQGIKFESQKEIDVFYKEYKLERKYRSDLICYDKIILELKAVSKICDEHRAQILNYLNATQYKLGILINFGGHPKIEYERVVLDERQFKKR